MSGHIVNLQASTHQAVQELLPWYVTGTLEGNELQMVQDHLQTCSQCRSDIEWQHKLHAALPDDMDTSASLDVEHALQRLRPQLETSPRSFVRAGLRKWRQALSNGNGSWMRWALAAQFVVIAALAVLVALPSGTAPAYRVLGSPGNISANLVVTLTPGASEEDIRHALQAAGARIVDGPTATDAYLLNVPDARMSSAIRTLHERRVVMLAEPLDAGGAR